MPARTNQRLHEGVAAREGFQDADISLGNIDSTVFESIEQFREVGAAASSSALANGETMTVTLLQATAAVGTAKKVLGAPTIVTAVGAVPVETIVSALVNEMDHANGFVFWGVRLTSNGAAAIEGRAVLLADRARANPVT